MVGELDTSFSLPVEPSAHALITSQHEQRARLKTLVIRYETTWQSSS